MELSSMKLKSFRKGRAKNKFAYLRALKHGARKIQERPRAFFASVELQRNLKSYKK
jgi:hypothetical protein